ncbi:ROK family protein [Curtobacterium flaccumfaciens]|nr:ROK family protein [Curtobacterium flaccumfaciens]
MSAEGAVLGVDVGGTGIKARLTDADGLVLDEARVPTPRNDPDAARLADCVADLASRALARGPLRAIGLVTPGVVDERAGTVVLAVNLGWHDVPVRQRVRAALSERGLDVPVAFGHDVRAGAVAETSGTDAALTRGSVAFVPVGTGLASALVVDGSVVPGDGWAGEIGQVRIPSGPHAGLRVEEIASAGESHGDRVRRPRTRRCSEFEPATRSPRKSGPSASPCSRTPWCGPLRSPGVTPSWSAGTGGVRAAAVRPADDRRGRATCRPAGSRPRPGTTRRRRRCHRGGVARTTDDRRSSGMTALVRARRILTATDDLHDGWLAVTDDGTVGAVGTGAPPRTDTTTTIDGTIVPGLVDLHAHGALGYDFATCSVDGAVAAAGHHRARAPRRCSHRSRPVRSPTPPRHSHASAPSSRTARSRGSTSKVPGCRPNAAARTAPTCCTPPVGGGRDVPGRRGRRAPDRHPRARAPGALDTVRRLVADGVVVAIGHTDASAEQTRRAIDAGATLVTHLFNGMPPMHHRTPGPVGIALTDDRVLFECIVDGHHLDGTTVDLVRRAAPERLVLVSDAMSATGCADGEHTIAGSAVTVRDGMAVLTDGSSLAGSTITVADAARRLLARGSSLTEVVAAAATRPARLLGRAAPLTVGAPAEIVAIDETSGRWTALDTIADEEVAP